MSDSSSSLLSSSELELCDVLLPDMLVAAPLEDDGSSALLEVGLLEVSTRRVRA